MLRAQCVWGPGDGITGGGADELLCQFDPRGVLSCDAAAIQHAGAGIGGWADVEGADGVG